MNTSLQNKHHLGKGSSFANERFLIFLQQKCIRLVAVRLVLFCLIFGLLSMNFSSMIIFAGFQINRVSIIKSACVNKNRPWLYCNGKCVLKKKLLEAQKKEKKQEIQSFVLDIICEVNSSEENSELFSFPIAHNSGLVITSPSSPSYPIFQPPG